MNYKKLIIYTLALIILGGIIYIGYIINVSIIKPNNEIREEIERTNTTSVTTQDTQSAELQLLNQVATSIEARDYETFKKLVDVPSFVTEYGEPAEIAQANSNKREAQLTAYFENDAELSTYPELEFLQTTPRLTPTASTTAGISLVTFKEDSAIVYLDQFEDTITLQGVDLEK